MIFCILNFSMVKESVSSAIEMCTTVLIPSVFVFTVLSSVIVRCGLPSFIMKPICRIFHALFGISACSAIALILGWCAGVPVGATSVYQLYSEGRISRNEAEYLLSFCSISGVSFVFGVVGGVVFKDVKTAAILYLVQIFSSVAVGILMKDTHKFEVTAACAEQCSLDVSKTIVSSVKNGIKSTANICGYVIFFSAICNILLHILPIVPEFPIRAAFELTTSILLVSRFPAKLSIVLASALLSWSGICIHLQIQSCVGGLSLKKYYIGKLLHVGISSLVTLLLPLSNNITAYRECISVNYRDYSPHLFFIIIFFVILGCFFLKNDVK